MDDIQKIGIKKSNNADTRTATDFSKSSLLNDTLEHIKNVQDGGKLIANLLVNQCARHDLTKIEYMDEFYADFSTKLQGEAFKKLGWWQKHMTERHHLNDKCPDDVNLIDVLEMIIDCSMAGLARSGTIYDINISNEILQKAVKNTVDLLKNNCEIING